MPNRTVALLFIVCIMQLTKLYSINMQTKTNIRNRKLILVRYKTQINLSLKIFDEH